MNDIKLIFLDLDGTLIDSNGVWLEVDRIFLSRRGLEVTEEYSHTVGHSIFPVAARFTVDYYHLTDTPEAIMAEWQALAADAYRRTIPLKPGADALLRKWQSEGRDMALLTSGVPDLAMAAVSRLGLDAYLTGYFFAHDVGLEKKDPQVYRLAAERFGRSPSDCALLEDAPHNCAAAKSVGFTVVGVYDSFYASRWEEVKSNSHRAVISLEELL